MQLKNICILFLCLITLSEWRICQETHAENAVMASWETAEPENNGFLKEPLEVSVAKIGAMEGVYGVVIARNGYLTYEKYFREGTIDKPHNLKSASKSVLSALIGIAIDKGYLRKDQFISDFFPFIKTLPDPRKKLITVQHLLNMTSGLQSMSYQAYNSWVINEDWLTKLLKLPIVADPGTKHQYSTGDTHILSAVLTAATGMSTKEFAEKYLFSPLQIKIKGWEVDPQGIYQGGNNLSLYTRDMVRFGQLYLDHGKANEQQIIPEKWVEESTSALQPYQHKVYGGYGYLWYSQPKGENAFVAVGYGGQYIYVSPDNGMVVVIISTLYSKGEKWEETLFEHIQHGILASLRDPSPAASPNRHNTTSTRSLNKPAPTRGIATTTLNLRKEPSIKSSILNTLEPGSIFEIIAKQKSWLQVETANQKGWIASKFAHIVQPENFAIAKPSHERTPPEAASNSHNVLLQKLQTSHEIMRERLQNLEQKQEKIPAGSISTEDEIISMKKEIAKFQKLAQKPQARDGQIQGYLDDLKKEIDQAESNFYSLNDKFLSSKNQFTTQLETNQKKMQDKYDAQKNEFLSLQKEIANLQELYKQALENSSQLQKSLKVAQREIDQIGGKHNALNDKFSSSHNQFTTQLETSRKDIALLTNKIQEDFRDISADLTKKMDSIDTSKNNEQANISKKLNTLHQGQTDLRKDLSTYEIVSQQHTAQIEKLTTSDKQSRINQAETNNELKSLKSGINGQEIQMNTAAAKNKNITTSINNNLVSMEKRLAQQEESLGKTNESITAHNEKLRNEIDREKLSKDQLLSKIDALKITIRSLIRQNEAIQKELIAEQNKDERIQEKIFSLDEELQKQHQLQQENNNAISEYQSQLATINKELLFLQSNKTSKEIPISAAHTKTTIRLADPEKAESSFPSKPEVEKIEFITPFISSWSNAWSSQNVDEFLLHYSDSFSPPKRLSLNDWKKNRHKYIKKPQFIKISISDLEKQMLDKDNAKVVFRQKYTSNTYSDSVRKTMLLKWEDSHWKIVKETSM